MDKETRARLYARNWEAVNDRLEQINAQHDELRTAVRELDLRVSAAVAQIRETLDTVSELRAQRFGTGPSAPEK